MRQIIHSYKLRLTNLSQGNRSLKLSRLSRRRDIDLLDLGGLENASAEELLARLLAGRDLKLIQRLDPRYERTNLADRRLNQIYRQVNTLFEETGTYDLFLGYPFVEGKFASGVSVRCPVMLFPVRLHRNLQGRPRWKLESLDDQPVQFNKTFFLAYEQYQQLRLPDAFWEEEVDRSSDWLQWLNDLYGVMKNYELNVNFNARLFDRKLMPFVDFRKEEMEAFKLGVLKFQPQAVLGIFPQSDSALLQDYETIEAEPEGFDLSSFFPQADQTPLPSQPEKGGYIKEEDRYFVTEVDQTQEEALLKIKQGKSLVIHGPPGTGKSQLIVNLIADAMAHGKRVLLVSQKRAALDVVYKRLGALGLNRFAVLVHDYRHDRREIFQKIRRQIEDIETFQRELKALSLTQTEHEYRLLSRQLDQLNRKYESLHQALLSREAFGISAHELYLATDSQALILPLSGPARQLKMASLADFLEKLRTLLDYPELLSPGHSWAGRLSFHHYTYEDYQRIETRLAQLPNEVAALQQQHEQLARLFEEELLKPGLNQQAIDQYRQSQALLNTPSIRKDIEHLLRDELPSGFVKERLAELSEVQDEMREMKLLKGFPWRLFSDLEKHVEHYARLQSKKLRMLTPAYLRARWFLKRWLESQGAKLDALSFEQVLSEFQLFAQVKKWYGALYEYGFFHDFPLLEDLEGKQQWLAQKQKHLKALDQIQGLKFFPQLKPRFAYGELEETHWEESLRHLAALDRWNRKLRDVLNDWKLILGAKQMAPLLEGIRKAGAARDFLDRLQQQFQRDFNDLKNLDLLLASLSGTEQEMIRLLSATEVWLSTPPDSLVGQVRNSVYFHWIEQLERQQPVLAEVSSRGWERNRQAYRDKLGQRTQKVSELIRARVKAGIMDIIQYNRLGNAVTYRSLYHQVSKKRRLWSVRRLVKESWEEGLQQLLPCWMASPEAASAIFPMQPDFFDLVIFDEASQCFVERAVPVMLRARQVVIAGDEKQLQPFDLYQVRYEEQEEGGGENEMALEVESILDLARRSMSETSLRWHYRSREEELINFSNHAFYEGKLQVIPPARPERSYSPVLEWVSVSGTWEQNRNQTEAEKVIELILALVQGPSPPSIGVVTFNYHQQELIKDCLESRQEHLAETSPKLYEQLQQALHKREQEEFQGIFVKNIENVQGDERDVIIFSVAYAPDQAGKLRAHFGLLNQRGGENRLNVAITRARRKVFVVCSFLPGQLGVQKSAHAGPRYFQSYLRYVKAVSEGRKEDALRLLDQQSAEDLSQQTENPIADQVAEALQKAGYHCLRNFGDTAYKLDLVVKASPEAADFLLGIECEGSHYFSGASSKEREVYRPNLMARRDWKIYRLWARNWWKSPQSEIANILARLENDN